MEEVKLSDKARRNEEALQKTNDRLLAQGLELEAKTKVLEALIQRRKALICREKD